jgi:hypothetical protein
MPNPNPRQTEEFKKHWFKPVGAVPPEKLERKPVAVTVGKSIYAAIYSLERPDRITWLRRVITEAAKRELLGQAQGTDSENPPTPAAPDSPHQVDVQELVQQLSQILTIHGIPQRARQAIKELIRRLQSSQGQLPLS